MWLCVCVGLRVFTVEVVLARVCQHYYCVLTELWVRTVELFPGRLSHSWGCRVFTVTWFRVVFTSCCFSQCHAEGLGFKWLNDFNFFKFILELQHCLITWCHIVSNSYPLIHDTFLIYLEVWKYTDLKWNKEKRVVACKVSCSSQVLLVAASHYLTS